MDNIIQLAMQWGEEKINHSNWVLSLRFDEERILRDICNLYLNGKVPNADVTYSTGNMWKNFDKPILKFDIDPQLPGVFYADCRDLPLENNEVESIMFDPPFVFRECLTNTGITVIRFGSFYSESDLLSFYRESMWEFYRVLVDEGILIFKCQDVCSSGKQYWTHNNIYNISKDIGYIMEDLFVLGRNSILWGKQWKRQNHARKNHCYYLVLRKIKK